MGNWGEKTLLTGVLSSHSTYNCVVFRPTLYIPDAQCMVIFSYIYHKFRPNVAKYTMDLLGIET